jgi:hypothetical protein
MVDQCIDMNRKLILKLLLEYVQMNARMSVNKIIQFFFHIILPIFLKDHQILIIQVSNLLLMVY